MRLSNVSTYLIQYFASLHCTTFGKKVKLDFVYPAPSTRANVSQPEIVVIPKSPLDTPVISPKTR